MAAVSHFTDVGFALDTSNEAAFAHALEVQTSHCALLPLDAQNFNCLIKDASGAELRIGLKRGAGGEWQIEAANPAFAGDGHTEVEIVADASDPGYKLFEVTISAQFTADQVPIVFELADPRDAPAFKPGAKISVDIAAFSYAPEIFADEAAYAKAEQKEKMPFAANYFIPSGTFLESVGGAMPDGAKRPTAYADFAGTVLKAELRTNTHGSKFWCTLVKTYGGAVIDVAMDPASVKTNPKPGTVVSGRFWLSARVAP